MNYRGWRSILLGCVLLLLAWGATSTSHAQPRGPIYSVTVEGVVTDVTVDFLRRALSLAEASDATALVLNLSSEGGVLRALRPFASEIAGANVPVVVYVAPEGTESGAPGAFFLSAAHVAAMAPDTSFGAPLPLAEVDEVLTEQTQELVVASVSDQIRAWNDTRGRNTAWVDQAVRSGVVRTNEQAFATEPPTIDLIARDTDELLTLLQGRTITLENGTTVQLETLGRTPTPITPNIWEQLLLLLATPTIAFLLLVLGGFAIYAELISPTVGIAGGLGGILLLGALFGLVVLPVRWLSVAGIIVGFVLIGLDIYLPSHGGLTVTGMAALIIGAFTLIDAAQAPNVFVALWAILVVALVVGTLAALGVWAIVQASGRPVSTGQEGLVGRLAEVRQELDPDGLVFIEGTLWRAITEQGPIERGEWVRVLAVQDLRLLVQSLETPAPPEADEQRAPPA